MSGAQALSARLALMLTELRVPTIKPDQEGWPGQRLLERSLSKNWLSAKRAALTATAST
jgi:hypothetical protein